MRAPFSGCGWPIFGARGHQPRHFGLGDRDFLAPLFGKLDVGNGVIVSLAHERRGGFGHGRGNPFFVTACL